MLEILALVFGTRHLKNVASRKGHTPWIAALFPVLWIMAELFGITVGTLASGEVIGGIAAGLVCAIAGGGTAFAIVYALPNRALDTFQADAPALAMSPKDIEGNVFA